MTRGIVSALVALSACSAAAADTGGAPLPSKECVFVVHGLARGNRSMAKLSIKLSRAGYTVVKVDYPSTKGSFQDMVSALAGAVARHGTSCEKVHFVGYSLGALVVRGYLEEASPARLGRVVLIAPPNHGSQIADALSRFRVFGKLMGPIATQLGTAPNDIPDKLAPPHYRLGIIAGDRSINPLGWLFVPGKHDGTVSVASARLEGMSDFLLVHRTHPFIMNAPEVANETIRFLRSGRF